MSLTSAYLTGIAEIGEHVRVAVLGISSYGAKEATNRALAAPTAVIERVLSAAIEQYLSNNPTCRFLTLSFSPEMAELWMHHVHSALFRATPYPVLLGTARFALRRRHVVRFQVEVASVLLPRRNGERTGRGAHLHPRRLH